MLKLVNKEEGLERWAVKGPVREMSPNALLTAVTTGPAWPHLPELRYPQHPGSVGVYVGHRALT